MLVSPYPPRGGDIYAVCIYVCAQRNLLVLQLIKSLERVPNVVHPCGYILLRPQRWRIGQYTLLAPPCLDGPSGVKFFQLARRQKPIYECSINDKWNGLVWKNIFVEVRVLLDGIL